MADYPGVKIFTKGDRIYAYHRKTRKRLPGTIGSPEFLAELARLDGRPAATAAPGTLDALFQAYQKSPEFTELAPRTRSDYAKVFDYLRAGAQRQLLVRLTAGDILAIRDAAFRSKKRHFANYCVVVLRLVLKWGTVRDLVANNPGAGVPKLRRPGNTKKANRPWTPAEIATVLDAAEGGVKVAIALGAYCGMREGDALRVTRANYDGAWMRWAQGKTGQPVDMPVDTRLKIILDTALAARQRTDNVVDLLPLAVGHYGKGYTLDGFRTMFWRLLQRLETAGQVNPDLTFHGLRHTAGQALANAGATPHEIAALLGHKTLAMAEHYSREANREQLTSAAVHRLRPRGEGLT